MCVDWFQLKIDAQSQDYSLLLQQVAANIAQF